MPRHRHASVRPGRRRRVRPRIRAALLSALATVAPVTAGVVALEVAAPPTTVALQESVVATADTPRPRPAPGTPVRLSDRVVIRASTALPPRSGEGRRVVFSESRQRVWLVAARDRVVRTYLVSGSAEDNLHPGTYEVYSRSEHAVGIDDSGTMRWFVRFTRGERAAIGFHSIPVDDGRPVQTVAQLGTPLSHGCIRQRMGDARALWDFAPLGTTVVVTP